MALTGPILAEVLRGFRRTEQANWVASRLRLAHYLEPNWDDWRQASALGRELAAKGHDVPLTNLIIAALARRVRSSVFTSDPHFDLISGLRRHGLASGLFLRDLPFKSDLRQSFKEANGDKRSRKVCNE